MSGSFKNPTKIDTKMTSNDYINSRKNRELFCDINNSTSKVHKVKSGKLTLLLKIKPLTKNWP